MSTPPLPELIAEWRAVTSGCLAQYAQIPLLAGGAIPPFDQVTGFSRMDMRSMSRMLPTEAAVLHGRKPSSALQRVNTTFHSPDSGPQLSQLPLYPVGLAHITLHYIAAS
jgi:hypothetical protein